MKKIIYLSILTLTFWKCSKSERINYKEIDKKIDCYKTSTMVISLIKKDKGDLKNSDFYSAVNNLISDINYMSNQSLNKKLSIEERRITLNKLNEYINKSSKKCKNIYGKYELNFLDDSNYIYRMKENYINCLLDSTFIRDTINEFCSTKGDLKIVNEK